MLKRLHLIARGVACILAGVPTTTLIPLLLTLRLFKRFEREKLLVRLHRMLPWARLCLTRIYRARLLVEGEANVPDDDRGHLYVSNHQSYVDILVLMVALRTAAFLSKQLVRWIPVLGACAYAGGSVFLDRNDPTSRARALAETLEMCRRSTGVVVFPEGTRSPAGVLREQIRPGMILAAHEAGLKVIPVALDGTGEVFPREMDRVGLDVDVRVSIGAPLDPADYESRDAWVEAVWGAVRRMHAELRARADADANAAALAAR